MKILFLSFYFEPDLSAGSFRNTSLFHNLLQRISKEDFIHVITTYPNRYAGFSPDTDAFEEGDNYLIERVDIPKHNGGFIDQAKSYIPFYQTVIRASRKSHYDLVYASSSRLFTAFLARRVATRLKVPLFLDIRDIFVDTMKDVVKNKLIRIPLIVVLKQIERYTFSKADRINLVSEGFAGYFKQYSKPAYSYYTNGIDDEFLTIPKISRNKSTQKIILYAGNIGEGQGLEKIIPEAAKQLSEGYRFLIIGSGGRRSVLEEALKNGRITNVELLPPVSRKDLLRYYQSADFLFLHLNDYPAFKKVLPSKIFEYAAFDKPIIAGVAGYANKFIKENVPNAILFEPANVNQFVERLLQYEETSTDRSAFVEKYARKNIMRDMSGDILMLLKA